MDRWQQGDIATNPSLPATVSSQKDLAEDEHETSKMTDKKQLGRRAWSRNAWATTWLVFLTTLAGVALLASILNSSVTRQLDPKGCRMSYMNPRYIHLSEFDTEHTRFASKYSLYLYREGGVYESPMVSGIPVLFVPGNAGSYKQVRPIAAEAARYFHDVLQHDPALAGSGVKNLDFFTVDFNEDFSAFHGQTMLDQAGISTRDPNSPDPTSVIVLGHSMGGIVARTMLIMPNYQSKSINTIVTMSAPHARSPLLETRIRTKVGKQQPVVACYSRINHRGWFGHSSPADYASVESIVPETHGFTVFTSSIPKVWSSMDHAAILWCDQFRKVITKALYEIVDNTRASQTKPRAERMRVFKKWFLSGMESIAEKTLPQAEPDILLTYGHDSSKTLMEGQRLTLRQLDNSGKATAHLMPVPPLGVSEPLRFTLLTDVNLDSPGENRRLEYDVEDVADHEFVAVVDKAMPGSPGWVVAEFSDPKLSMTTNNISFRQLLTSGVHVEVPPQQPMVTEMRIPSIRSSLFAYDLRIDTKRCDGSRELFAPLVRQFMSEPYESRFFVNAQDVKVSLHGLAPYVPPPMRPRRSSDGISFQFWTDPDCGSSMTISLTVDPLGSLGKLVMRYRTVFAAFPLLVVAMVIRKQFRVYDSTGVFVPFLDSLDMCLRQSLPLLFISLTLLAMATGPVDSTKPGRFWPWENGTAAIDFSQNDLLIGTSDPVFWFMIPMIGLVCVGVCTSLHYMTVLLISVCSIIYRYMTTRPAWVRYDDKRRTVSPMFSPSSPRRRLVITGILLFLVSTFIPYQFAFVVACLVQLTTCVRALHFAREVPSPANSNFYNYVHSIFQLMLWVLPINLPTLVKEGKTP
ncbi:PGAP1-domain-containing protein [Apiospora phragmitis]|uniref:GPI inositol-deacylase n=1 Tax=Apiospora phragmitis TaxID=2905665 RepID=A0ABR1T8A6_9PEZI